MTSFLPPLSTKVCTAYLLGEDSPSATLAKLSRNGVASHIRSKVWKLLTGYIPCDVTKQDSVVKTKRDDYQQLIVKLFNSELSINESNAEIQINKDLLRTNKEIPCVLHPKIQQLMKRILLIYAIKHPAIGYVQGMNDLIIPFVSVFLTDYIQDITNTNLIDVLSEKELLDIESDAYWCFSWMLQSIQSHYTYDQPGIHERLNALESLTCKYVNRVHKHLKMSNIEYIQFAFRWINCCLVREFPIRLLVRIWDGYFSEPNGTGFDKLNLYCCCALLSKFEDEIVQKDFMGTLTFLLNLPTRNWSEDDITELLANAYSYMQLETCV